MVGTHKFFQIFYEEHDRKNHFYGNLLGRLSLPVELSHEWVLTNSKHQELSFYAILFDDSGNGPFKVPPSCKKVGIIRKSVPGAPKLYVL